MLVLSRQVGERIVIGDNVVIEIVRITRENVRIGISAPADINIVREELINRDQAKETVNHE